jgi:CDP-4-dehydro-6-deoxyglucose reductase, E1
VTIGRKVRRFEEEFAAWCGARGSVFLNSGSSANLLAFFALTNGALRGRLKRGDEVVVPSVSWSTTVFPIADAGLVPVLVDSSLDTLNVDPSAAEEAVGKRTGALMPVHVLGNPADMPALMKTAKRHGLYVVEDACEAHGATVEGKKVGTFGDMSTFSFYFSHHMTTIEGGSVVSDNEGLLELVKVLRAHGYSRDLKDAARVAARYPNIDARFLFVNRGFNLRPTEVSAAFGIQQLPKLDAFIEGRRALAAYYDKRMARHAGVLRVQKELPGHRNVRLGYSLLVEKGAPFTRKQLVEHLEAAGIETRPVIAGNLAEHPAMKMIAHKVRGKLPNARYIMRNGMYMGCHNGIGREARAYVMDTVDEFVRKNA